MSGTVRAARVEDAEAIGWVSVVAWRETYAGIMPDDYLAGLSVAQRVMLFRQRIEALPERQAIFVGEDAAGKVVGFGVAGPTREAVLGTDGEIFAINIVAAAQRKRLGVHLMSAMAEMLSATGFARAGLWVIEQNAPARRFYERLGGREAARKEQLFGQRSLVELGYVWPSAEALRQQALALTRSAR